MSKNVAAVLQPTTPNDVSFTIARNLTDQLVVVPHGSRRDIPAIVIDPRGEVIVEDPDVWNKSANFIRAQRDVSGRPRLIEVYEGQTPSFRPSLPVEISQNLTAQNLHTVEQILGSTLEKALEIINVKPQGDDTDSDTGISEVGRTWLVQRHMRVLRAALWLEEHWNNRPKYVAALKRRIREIQELVSPV